MRDYNLELDNQLSKVLHYDACSAPTTEKTELFAIFKSCSEIYDEVVFGAIMQFSGIVAYAMEGRGFKRAEREMATIEIDDSGITLKARVKFFKD